MTCAAPCWSRSAAPAASTPALADALGLTRVLLHPLAGVLSAYGIGQARPSVLRERTLRQPLEEVLRPRLEQEIEALVGQASSDLEGSGDLAPSQKPRWQARLELRYRASDQGLELPWPATAGDDLPAELRTSFEARHRQRFGFAVPDASLVVERLQVEVGAPVAEAATPTALFEATDAPPPPAPCEWVPLCLAEEHGAGMVWRQVPLWRREQLAAGQRIAGPALVVEPTGTTVLEPGWGGRVLAGASCCWSGRRRPSGRRLPPAAPGRWIRCGWSSTTIVLPPSPSRWGNGCASAAAR